MPARRAPDAPFQPNLYLVARFLDALARPGEPPTRSALQAAVGVNYDIFRRYLAFLEERGFVAAAAEVRLTAEGRRVREELRRWLERFLAPPPAEEGLSSRQGDDRPAAAPP